MLNTHAKRVSALAVITLWLAACGGGLEVLVIPLFEFGFAGTSTAGQAITLSFRPDTPGKNSGTFDVGGVTLNVAGTDTSYDGRYLNCSFELIPSGAVTVPASPSYKGRFMNKDTIELTLSAGVGVPLFTLSRNHPVPGKITADFGC